MKRKKRQLRIIPLLLAIAIFFSISAIALGSNNLDGNVEYHLITIEKNDTIWELVEKYYPNYNGNKQKAIYKIKKFNNLDNSSLFIGQEIKLPVDL